MLISDDDYDLGCFPKLPFGAYHMYPHRPSFTDPHAPYRATTPPFIDFFAKESAEQQESADVNTQQNPFAPLAPMETRQTPLSAEITHVGSSAARQATIITIQRYLLERGYMASSFLMDETIQCRLDAAYISAQTLLTALQIAYDVHHPVLAGLRLSEKERSTLIKRLAGMTQHDARIRQTLAAAKKSNNNPEQLIVNLLESIRL